MEQEPGIRNVCLGCVELGCLFCIYTEIDIVMTRIEGSLTAIVETYDLSKILRHDSLASGEFKPYNWQK